MSQIVVSNVGTVRAPDLLKYVKKVSKRLSFFSNKLNKKGFNKDYVQFFQQESLYNGRGYKLLFDHQNYKFKGFLTKANYLYIPTFEEKFNKEIIFITLLISRLEGYYNILKLSNIYKDNTNLETILQNVNKLPKTVDMILSMLRNLGKDANIRIESNGNYFTLDLSYTPLKLISFIKNSEGEPEKSNICTICGRKTTSTNFHHIIPRWIIRDLIRNKFLDWFPKHLPPLKGDEMELCYECHREYEFIISNLLMSDKNIIVADTLLTLMKYMYIKYAKTLIVLHNKFNLSKIKASKIRESLNELNEKERENLKKFIL